MLLDVVSHPLGGGDAQQGIQCKRLQSCFRPPGIDGDGNGTVSHHFYYSELYPDGVQADK